jgi:hypothetical protein
MDFLPPIKRLARPPLLFFRFYPPDVSKLFVI